MGFNSAFKELMNTVTAANAARVEANIQQIDSCFHSDADD